MIAGKAQFLALAASRYYDELFAFVTAKLHCRHEAADVVQETFVRLVEVEDPGVIQQPRAFLYRIAHNLSVDVFRKQQVRHAHLVDVPDLTAIPSSSRGPDEAIQEDQEFRALREAIASLPPRRRQVFALYRFKNMPQTEIAAKLGISVTMVERHVRKAMLHCRERMKASR
ncbi:RNA polymerase sigma factor FecI [Nitrospira sp. KM1]|uniref:RNA polymerase sigma factor n=1 Tax=Nitrospira sp. KM1 TaxID=1936990 RepID=UPI0013A72DC5|nr:sigma-70 family RNA polymerase sigma factor [Nitrospira sp. KM1]BCA56615.1 RNA polymerase sigma factor FecI [Nitrospira sp. KM1]